MAATHSCIRTSKTKASLCNIPEKTNASCKGTGYYLQKSPWIWLQFAQWPSMFLQTAGWFFLECAFLCEYCSSSCEFWRNGELSESLWTPPALSQCVLLSLVFYTLALLRRLGHESGYREGCGWLSRLWMHSKISYMYWDFSALWWKGLISS